MYLYPIFMADDIQKQIPAEARRFESVDATWRKTMEQAATIRLVLRVCASGLLLERLKEANRHLGRAMRGLEIYLDRKRQIFPRFYFLSDDELVSVRSTHHHQHLTPHRHSPTLSPSPPAGPLLLLSGPSRGTAAPSKVLRGHKPPRLPTHYYQQQRNHHNNNSGSAATDEHNSYRRPAACSRSARARRQRGFFSFTETALYPYCAASCDCWYGLS